MLALTLGQAKTIALLVAEATGFGGDTTCSFFGSDIEITRQS